MLSGEESYQFEYWPVAAFSASGFKCRWHLPMMNETSLSKLITR